MGRPVTGSVERTIQIHCGGQTLAQIPQEVQRIVFSPFGSLIVNKKWHKAEFLRDRNLSSGYCTVKIPRASLPERWAMPYLVLYLLPTKTRSSRYVSAKRLRLTPRPFKIPLPYMSLMGVFLTVNFSQDISIEPSTPTRSATFCPTHIGPNAVRLINEGART